MRGLNLESTQNSSPSTYCGREKIGAIVEIQFLQRKLICVDLNFIKVFFGTESYRQNVKTDLVNGLAPDKRQTITCTRANQICQQIYASTGLNMFSFATSEVYIIALIGEMFT